jgi:aldehyde dehydrogenase (NAD+)
MATEILTSIAEVDFILSKLQMWMKPTKVPGVGLNIFSFNSIEHRPLGEPGVLVIGPSNYPFSLCIFPIIGALSGGNPVVCKPSELCPATSRLLKGLIEKYFERGVLTGMFVVRNRD